MSKHFVQVILTEDQAQKVLKATEEKKAHYLAARMAATEPKAMIEAATTAAEYSLISLEILRAIERAGYR